MDVILRIIIGIVIIICVFFLGKFTNYFAIRLFTIAFYSENTLLNKAESFLEFLAGGQKGIKEHKGFSYHFTEPNSLLGIFTLVLLGIVLFIIWLIGSIFLAMMFKMGTLYNL